MKKTYSNNRKVLFFLGVFAVCLSFFNTSCGLDVLDAVLDDPFSTDTIPNESSDYDSMTFKFSTSKLDNANDFGKAYVYYKIYNSVSTKDSEKSNIDSITSDSSRRHNAYSTLINSYSYQSLHYVKTSGGQDQEFLLDNKAQDVTIRLTNYGTEAFSANITVDGNTAGIPVRLNGKSFDFGRTGDNDEKPVKVPSAEENTSDVKRLLDDPSIDVFYVVLYGIFYMPSDSFDKTIYSPVHYLGEVKIDASKEFN